MLADDLLRGALDLHVHGYPELAFDVQTRSDDVEIAKQCQEAGLAGFVLKSHLWPTVGRVYHVKKIFPDMHIVPSITLNWTAGGLSPISVESAARQGAKVVFMPTWSAANDLGNGGFGEYMKRYFRSAQSLAPQEGITLLTVEGQLRPEVKDIVQIAKEHELVIATGHISPEESLVLLDEVNRAGNVRVVFTHPYSSSVGGNLQDMKAMAQGGAYIEICALAMMPAFQTLSPEGVINIVREIGAEQCVLSTDFFFDWAPPPPEMLRMIVGTLLMRGLSDRELRCLIQTNPASIIGL